MSFNILRNINGGIWLIEQNYAQAFMPAIRSMLEGKPLSIDAEVLKQRREMARPYFMDRGGNQSNPSSTTGLVAVLSYKDPIIKYAEDCGPEGTQILATRILEAAKNPNIAGIVLDMDSGGGSGDAVQAPVAAIKEARKSKPVICYAGDGMLASAAYWIGSACDEIYCTFDTDQVGSIGAYITLVDVEAAWAEYYGAKVESVYATKSTAKNKGYNDWRKTGDVKYLLQHDLNPFNEVFHRTVREHRGTKVNEDVFDGRLLMASDALSFGLIDGMKTFAETIERVFELAEERNTSTASNQKANSMKVLVGGKDATIDAINAGVNVTAEELTASNAELAESGLTLLKSVDYTAAQQLATDAQSKIDAANTAHQTAANALATANTQLSEVATALGLTAADGKYTNAEGKEVTIAEAATAVVAERDEYGKKSAAAPAANATERTENEEKEEDEDPVNGYFKEQLNSF